MTDEIQKKISENYNAMTELQLDKNKKYGNAALEPLGVFFRGGAYQGCKNSRDLLPS